MVSCTECGKVFHNKSYLIGHMRVMHGQDRDDVSEDDVESAVNEEESSTDDEQSASSDTEEVDV